MAAALPAIPVIASTADLATSTFAAAGDRARELLDEATRRTPRSLLQAADRTSRAWLVRAENPYLNEIDAVAARLGRPGGHFFNMHYEWGCTTGVKPGRQGEPPRLVRVLDWRTPGLGRHVVVAHVASKLGTWTTLTWPGFAGVLQASALGRFAAALNQAPMDLPVGLLPADWLVNRVRAWRTHALPPAHLLRQVFEEEPDFAGAVRRLSETPICLPAIFTICGVVPGEGAVIERRETKAIVYRGEHCAANAWQTSGWRGRARGKDNAGRLAQMRRLDSDGSLSLGWLRAPVFNATTRLVMVAEAASGHLLAQGYEAEGPATAPLHLAPDLTPATVAGQLATS